METKKRGRKPKITVEAINELFARGLNQKQIAAEIGVHPVSLSAWMSKRKKIKLVI